MSRKHRARQSREPSLLTSGDLIQLKRGMRVYVGESTEPILVGVGNKLQGRYRVVATSFDGGGTGMGDHDVYPNGHHVHAEKILVDGTEAFASRVHFYQTGSFTAMIRPEEISAIT